MKNPMKNWKATLQSLAKFLAPSLVLGALVGIYPGYKTYEYTWKDAGFCYACHVHDYATVGWKKSAHGKLTTCHDCHHQPLHAYFYETYLMVTSKPKFPRDLHHTPHVPRDLCEACHITQPHDQSNITGPLSKEDVLKIPKVDQTRLHKIHLEKKTKFPPPSAFHLEEQKEYGLDSQGKRVEGPERPIACVDCHGAPPNRAHHFTAMDQSCLKCHDQVKKHEMLKETGCRSCHFQGFMIQGK